MNANEIAKSTVNDVILTYKDADGNVCVEEVKEYHKHNCDNCDNCKHCYDCDGCYDVINGVDIKGCEHVYNSQHCAMSHDLQSCTYCYACSECKDCDDCNYCMNCVNCTNQDNKRYMIDNEQLTEEEYWKHPLHFDIEDDEVA